MKKEITAVLMAVLFAAAAVSCSPKEDSVENSDILTFQTDEAGRELPYVVTYPGTGTAPAAVSGQASTGATTTSTTVTDNSAENISIDISEINSEHATLIDAETGEIIAEKNGGGQTFPASMTKIMTAILAIEHRDKFQNGVIIPTEAVVNAANVDGSLAGFYGGEAITFDDLIYGILLPSGCECCSAAAITVSGSEDAFVDLMNQKAAMLGMTDTHFMNPTGLHDYEHYTTTRDMVKLMRYCYQNDYFREVDTTYSHIATNGIYLVSTMFNTIYSVFPDSSLIGGQIIGGKTGTTFEAGSCLCSVAEIYGKEYILCTTESAYKGLNAIDAKTVYNKLGEALSVTPQAYNYYNSLAEDNSQEQYEESGGYDEGGYSEDNYSSGMDYGTDEYAYSENDYYDD